ncbi:MAG: ATP-binding cassette domain-containing protein [Candidatus Limnocylindrales bacterium]
MPTDEGMGDHALVVTRPASGKPDAEAIDEVCVEELTKSFGGVRTLDSMDLTVKTGQIHAVVGENGAGKSTLMKILAGALRPDGGTIRFREADDGSFNAWTATRMTGER